MANNKSHKKFGKGFVKVIGTRLNKYIEFEFSLNDSDLAVELILPPKAFETFCEVNDVVILTPDENSQREVSGLLNKFSEKE